ncbi:benzoate 4-monooxygenase cytochrome P450 [Xylaria scruposa]|nr:benzoate 4-monooxygenase cytochrome P450 [Xylaria scruposa]
MDIELFKKWSRVLVFAVPLYVVYWLVVFIYRITLHPLAKFPGPKLAGATFWYEFYYDVWPTRYRYMWKIQDLHRQYGPIVRINPIHIHIYDPDFLDPIYAPARRQRRNGDPWFAVSTESGMMGWSMLQTMDHQLHHVRKAALSQFFSKRAVRQLEGLITNKIERLLERLATAHSNGEPVVNLTHAMAALTMDVISSYSLGIDMGNLSREGWGRDWFETFRQLGTIRPIGRQFKTLTVLSLHLEPWFVRWFSPTAAAVAARAKYPMDSIQTHIEAHQKGTASTNMVTNTRTIFSEILDSELPPEEKSVGRLNAEAFLTLGAGTDPTTRNLTVTIYYILTDPAILKRAMDELKTLMPHPASAVTLAKLDSLPFFCACITEGLRLTNAVSTRAPRISPDHDIKYKQWIIPKGTPVMQSLYLTHMNSNIFPEPEIFKPDRWLDNPSLKTRYFMAFGRGTRNCLGINLANAELLLTIAHILCRFEMEPYNVVKQRDVDVIGDCFNGITCDDTPGIQVKILKDRLIR